ncbi:hypothetical protein [Amycolatopsis sp. NBC_01480]|uniref:hypothetical protein n=1 Tax=Amycolatopsis sp. NBC_01480 TaxID=2903562 RepID=UPI002E2BC8F4|nr:hypothetical protein [Amycolatopsis sp. NBC_01480]
MPRNPYRITAAGLIGSAALGVYLSTVPLGLVAMIGVAALNPSMLLTIPFYAGAGALSGVIVAWLTRPPRTTGPSLRRRRFAIAGALTLPFAIFVGQLDVIIRDSAAGPRLGGLIFFCGAAGVVTYYLLRRSNTLRELRRRADAAQSSPPARVTTRG